MARNSNENEDDKIDPASVVSNVKNSFKQAYYMHMNFDKLPPVRKKPLPREEPARKLGEDVIKELLNSSFEDNKMKLGNDALSLVVEVAKCLVTETCLRASSQALRESCDKVDIEHVEKCLPQLMLDFP